jgi:hypothetical protein
MAKDAKKPGVAGGGRLWTVLTFDRLITGPVIHFVYWAGLGVIVVGAFALIGGVIGMAWRDGGWAILLAGAILVVGLVVMIGAALLWRAFCEFYVAILRIGDDLAALRRVSEREARP